MPAPMSVWLMLVAVLVLSGVVFIGVALAWVSPLANGRRIRPEQARKVGGSKLWGRVLGNMAMSGALVFALTYVAYPWLIDESATMSALGLGHAIVILLVYDLLYYFLHRNLFHGVSWLKKVHAVHHVIRAPMALESLYLHPLETFLGQALLTVVACVLGPVAPVTYALMLAVHSTLNIIVHAGLDLPFFPFRALSYLSRKHAVHHISMRGGNFASLTPLWDLMFGTAE